MDFTKSGKFSKLRVPTSKYEKSDANTQNWWNRVFKIMKENAIPEQQRIEVICKIFPEEILNRVLFLMNLNVPYNFQDPRNEYIINRENADDVKNHHSLRYVGQNNPYMNFFKRSNNAAAIWRKSTVKIETLNLLEKAERVVEEVASDFVNWLRKLNNDTDLGDGDQEMDRDSVTKIFKDAFDTTVQNNSPDKTQQRKGSGKLTRTSKSDKQLKSDSESPKTKQASDTRAGLNIPQVMKMFEVGVQFEASTSLNVAIKEMPSVIKSIAKSRNLPQKHSYKVLQKFIRNDIKDSRKTPKLNAFGKCLPIELRCIPASKSCLEWRTIKHPHKDLATMATVWKGITDIPATKQYCRWLRENKQINLPEYLLNDVMLNPELWSELS